MDHAELEAALRRHEIDTASLTPLFASGRHGCYRLRAAGAEALALWETLRSLVDETGFWPVILGGDRDLEAYADEDWRASGETPEAMVEAGARLDPHAWIQVRLGEHGGELPRGVWPANAAPNRSFTIPYDMRTGQPLATVYVALVPTRLGWQAPAFLRYGGWNECPDPVRQVCMMKYWWETYGAEPLGLARDRVEMKVSRPPRDRERALDLAHQQYAYCPDIVDQGTETLDVLAALVLEGTAWYFWWD